MMSLLLGGYKNLKSDRIRLRVVRDCAAAPLFAARHLVRYLRVVWLYSCKKSLSVVPKACWSRFVSRSVLCEKLRREQKRIMVYGVFNRMQGHSEAAATLAFAPAQTGTASDCLFWRGEACET